MARTPSSAADTARGIVRRYGAEPLTRQGLAPVDGSQAQILALSGAQMSELAAAEGVEVMVTGERTKERALDLAPGGAVVFRVTQFVVRAVDARTEGACEALVHLRLADSHLFAGSAKPQGVRAALIFVAIGDEPPERGSAGWRYHSSTGRLTFDVSFPLDLAPGTKVWICAAWVNTRNEPGPACSAVGTLIRFDTHIQFGKSMGLAA